MADQEEDRDVMGQDERELLARITLQIDRCSMYEHRMARRRAVLRAAATELRLGRMSTAVLALIQEQVPDAVRVMQPDSEEE